MTKPNIDVLEQRVLTLESNHKELNSKLSKIMDNHLPHIQAKLETVKLAVESTKTRVTVTTILNVGSIIIGLLVVKLLNL